MEVVINIPDGCYEELNNGQFPIQEAYRLVAWIKEGKVLPKGHGRLVDVNAIKKRMIPLDFSVQKWISEVDLDLFTRTIIEADKETKYESNN